VQIHRPTFCRQGIASEQDIHRIILGCICLGVVSFSLTAVLLLFYPYAANYGETPLLNQALHINAGHNIYKSSLQIPPYSITNYTPLYPLLIGVVHRLSHLPLFVTGRSLSILASITSSLMIGFITCRWYHSATAGYLAVALFLGHPYVGLWSGLVRVDTTALAFSLTGLWIVSTRWRSPSWLALATICLLAAVFTRQTYLLAAPFASTVWLYHNDRRRGIAFAAIFVLLGLAVYLVLNFVTQGGFYQNIVIANVNRFDLERTWNMSLLFFLTAPVLPILTIIGIRKTVERPIEPFFTWGLLPYAGGALLTALTVGKIGSDINYFLELIAGSVIWAAGLFSQKPGRTTVVLLVFHSIWTMAFSGVVFHAPLVKMWKSKPEIDALARQVQQAARAGPVLADDRLDLVVLANQDIVYQPFEYTQLYEAGKWDPTVFIDEISNRIFPMILINPAYYLERWPPPVYEAIQSHYTCQQHSGLLVCLP
jgi:hypothetical protein